MFSWINPSLTVREHPLGKAVYADKPLSKDTRLAVFGGYVMTLEEESELPEHIRDYAHQIDDDLVLGVKEEGQEQTVDHFNHSCEPNAGFKGQIFLVAMRDIAEGEEVTFDYAMVIAEAPSPEEFPYQLACECGAPTCRKVVTDSDWRSTELQERYAGYFQYYIQQKIESMNTL